MNVIPPGHRLTAFVAAALVSSAAPAVSPGAATAAPSAGQAASSLVVSPKSGKRVSSHLVRIVVRAPDEPGALDARLNGVKVGEEFGPARRGLRTLAVSASHGLKRGRNTLRVRVHVAGRRDRTYTRRFVLTTKGPLVGAGRDRRIVVGTQVPLASRVVPHPTAGSRSRSIRWRHVRSSARGARSRHATLRRSTSRQASFTARTPGRHTVRMTLGSGRSDNVTLTAVPASALQVIDTGETQGGGAPGIRVGDTFYTPQLGQFVDYSTYVQVLVFQRDSLQFVSNTGYNDLDKLAADLAKLTDGHLVIAALGNTQQTPRPDLEGTTSLAAVLGRIGFPSPSVVGGLNDRPGGTVTAIGVPGMKAGEADVNYNPAGAAMKGYLLPDRFLEYGFVSPDPRKITQKLGSGGTCDTDCDVGYLVSDIDPYTLQVIDGKKFVTNPQRAGSGGDGAVTAADSGAEARRMTSYLNAIPPGRLVRIEVQSHWAAGTMQFLPPIAATGGGPDGLAMNELAAAVARVGGTRNGFNRAALQHGAPGGQPVYSLIGWSGAGEAKGAEAAVNVDGAGPLPILSATLRRDRNYMYRPSHAAPFGRAPSPIQELALSPPGKGEWWPAGEPRETQLKRALAYIGAAIPVVDLSCDPQSRFWIVLDTASAANNAHGQIGEKIRMPEPGDASPCTGGTYSSDDFSKDDFAKAKAELKSELLSVASVRTLMETLAVPFDGTAGLNDWADVETLADDIYESAQKPKGVTGFEWVKLTEILLKLAGPLTSGFSSTVAETLEFGEWVAGAAASDGTPSGQEVRFQADQLATQIVKQAESQAATLKRVGDIFVSDPAKMAKLLCDTGDTCPAEFKAADALAKTRATAAVARAVRRTAYTKLFGLGYRFTFLNSYPHIGATGTYDNDGTRPPDPGRYDCTAWVHPFRSWPTNASDALLYRLTPQDLRYSIWQPFVVTANPGSDLHGTPPPEAMLRDMLGPVPDSNDPAIPGLAMSLTELSYDSEHYGWRVADKPGADTNCSWDEP